MKRILTKYFRIVVVVAAAHGARDTSSSSSFLLNFMTLFKQISL